MARYMFQFISAAVPGEDDAYNRWYEDVHIPEVLSLPGYLSCQRYLVIDSAASRTRYLAAYEVECDDPLATMEKLVQTAKTMVMSPAMDAASTSAAILKLVGSKTKVDPRPGNSGASATVRDAD